MHVVGVKHVLRVKTLCALTGILARKTSSSTWKMRKLSDLNSVYCNTTNSSGKLGPRKPMRMTPSRARRNARQLQAFLESKRQNQSEQVCKPASQSTGDVDLDLKSFIDKEVQCVDFQFTNGQSA